MDKEEIREAAELLIQSDNYGELKHELMRLIADTGIPKRFAGKYAPLNALIALHKSREEYYHNMIRFVESSRKKDPETNRTDYQKNHMRQRRARLITAVLIEELRRGRKMTPTEKDAFRSGAQARWMARRDTFLASKGTVSWAKKNDLVAEFWQCIDEELEVELVKVKQEKTGR